ncbi:hypothetical protein [Streptomyces sp. NPDC090022]|uniref:hypothetical protein n=1 Tax=Streptomyces sp. NPDC090022 TaxID=3365920 RepID=UPI00382D5BF4
MSAPTTGHRPVDAEQTGRRVEDVLDRLAATGDPAAGSAAEELVRSLMDFYGSGLARILELLSAPGGRRPADGPLAALLGDELVASLLVLHDLHPEDRDTRVARALAAVRGHTLEAVAFDEASGTLRLRAAAGTGGGAGTGCGCASTADSARQAAQDALGCFAPEVLAVEVEQAPKEPPLLHIGPAPRTAAGARATAAERS